MTHVYICLLTLFFVSWWKCTNSLLSTSFHLPSIVYELRISFNLCNLIFGVMCLGWHKSHISQKAKILYWDRQYTFASWRRRRRKRREYRKAGAIIFIHFLSTVGISESIVISYPALTYSFLLCSPITYPFLSSVLPTLHFFFSSLSNISLPLPYRSLPYTKLACPSHEPCPTCQTLTTQYSYDPSLPLGPSW